MTAPDSPYTSGCLAIEYGQDNGLLLSLILAIPGSALHPHKLSSGLNPDTVWRLGHCENIAEILCDLRIFPDRCIHQGAIVKGHRFHVRRRVRHTDGRRIVIDRALMIVLLGPCHSSLVGGQRLAAVREGANQPAENIHLSRFHIASEFFAGRGLRVLGTGRPSSPTR